MKVVTERFGEIDVNLNDIITFPKGLLAFEELTKYILLPTDSKQESPFFFLQSLEQENLCFVVLDTLSFFKEYEIEVDERTIDELNIREPGDTHVLSMVTVKDSLKDATTNLKAPLIININNKIGKQVVLEKGDYSIKQNLFTPEAEYEKIGHQG